MGEASEASIIMSLAAGFLIVLSLHILPLSLSYIIDIPGRSFEEEE